MAVAGCLSEAPEGLHASKTAATTVKMDFFHRPLPELPLPNDIATRFDPTSATGRRINASMVAPTRYEARTRELIDQLDGWGVFMPISVPFTGPLDPTSVTTAHPPDDYALADDVIYLIDIDPDSPDFGRFHHLDVGQGNYPVVLEQRDRYWENDPRSWTNSLVFEEVDEDLNGNGVLDPGEDTDADGVLDKPNYLPGADPAPDDLAARADALMTFYERETNTLLARPMMPLRERTTYAVVVTRRLLDADGQPVGSPYPFINHESQTETLAPLADALAKEGQTLDDVAFTFTFTTQSVESYWKAVREGLYGRGVQAHLGQEFPAEVGGLEPLLDEKVFTTRDNLFAMHHEDWAGALGLVAQQFLNADEGSLNLQKLLGGHEFVDYHVVGWYESPQLFERRDDAGALLPLNDQSWPEDLDRRPAPARGERVYFHLVVPRKEVSARADGKPAPVVILGHGYTGNRFDAVTLGGYFARHGVAVIAIDNVSHGIELSPSELETASSLLNIFGLSPALQAMTQRHRTFDMNADGSVDSGADFWTAYLFHTRDVVRQTALDYMQLVRLLRSFDGSRRGKIDVNGDGQPELAGDFDGDGVVDVGGEAMITMSGASLGGIMSTMLGGLEPELEAVVPIAAGGGLGDVGLRSIQGGVPEAVILRALGPLFIGTQGPDAGAMGLQMLVPNLNRTGRVPFATVKGVSAGDFVVVENKSAGTRACGYVHDDEGTLRFRTGLESNRDDHVALHFYAGDAMLLGSTECEVKDAAAPRVTIDTYQVDGSFQGRAFKQGDPLLSVAEGMGLPRSSPRLRRFLGLTQLVLDNADPAVAAPFMQLRPFAYPNGQTTHTNMLLVTTAGDMNVPASTGVSIARAAGLVDYLTPHPDYGTSINQVLIDTYTVEAVHNIKRFTDSAGNGVIMDVENFGAGIDPWGDEIPRLDPPLRLGFDQSDAIKTPFAGKGGVSSAIFPFPVPDGQHGFAFPGQLVDEARKKCKAECAEGADCGCDAITDSTHYDIGSYLFNMMARYLATGGRELPVDMCMSDESCDFLPTAPAPRDLAK